MANKKNQKTQLTEEDVIICTKVIPEEQLRFTVVLTQEEEGEYFKQVLKNVADTYRKINTDDELVNKNGSYNVGFHYFTGATDVFISQIHKDGTGFGYTILNGDCQMSEWGYVDLNSLIKNPRIEMDYHVPKGKTIEQMLHEAHPDYFPEPKKTQKKNINLGMEM